MTISLLLNWIQPLGWQESLQALSSNPLSKFNPTFWRYFMISFTQWSLNNPICKIAIDSTYYVFFLFIHFNKSQYIILFPVIMPSTSFHGHVKLMLLKLYYIMNSSCWHEKCCWCWWRRLRFSVADRVPVPERSGEDGIRMKKHHISNVVKQKGRSTRMDWGADHVSRSRRAWTTTRLMIVISPNVEIKAHNEEQVL